ncbi:hypothetical protein GALMADRAFT_251156 [Galerina marginata CBS 339.88]|uniref:Uncharacterized protein n=1 Tax=Galerina marginata (strain CBS 339.88) TaxID=685588 RepID=A0A067STX4_GALM3|nr:hypothetical protein GALMADRAFT_251156 [Galerina marginata CBS 339.88]
MKKRERWDCENRADAGAQCPFHIRIRSTVRSPRDPLLRTPSPQLAGSTMALLLTLSRSYPFQLRWELRDSAMHMLCHRRRKFLPMSRHLI